MLNRLSILTFSEMVTGIALVAVLGTCTSSHAQQPAKAENGSKGEVQNLIQVFAIKYIDAQAAAETISPLLRQSQLSMTVDVRTNSILANGTAEAMKELTLLLERIDTKERDQEQIKTIAMGDEATIRTLVNMLNSLKLREVDYAIADGAKLVVRGKDSEIERVEEILELIRPTVESTSRDLLVELIWLTETPLPGAVKFNDEVAAKLSQRGFRDLFVLSQLEVSTIAGSRCEAQGAASIGSIECSFTADTDGQHLKLTVDLLASYGPGSNSEKESDGVNQIRFQTSVKTIIDRWIIFGVAQRADAVNESQGRDLFLIRVREQEAL